MHRIISYDLRGVRTYVRIPRGDLRGIRTCVRIPRAYLIRFYMCELLRRRKAFYPPSRLGLPWSVPGGSEVSEVGPGTGRTASTLCQQLSYWLISVF